MNYNVQVADFTPGIQALTQGVVRRSQFEQAKARGLEQQKKREEAASIFQAGDIDKISDFMIKNPFIKDDFDKAFKWKNDATKQNAIESARRVIMGENPQDVLAERVGVIMDEGGDPSGTIELAGRVAENEEEALKEAKMTLAIYAPEELKALQSLEPKKTDDQREHAQAKQEGFEGSLLEYKLQKGGKDKTEAIKEYEYGLKNPGFLNKKRKKEDNARTKEVSKQTYDNTEKLRKEFLKQSGEYQKVRDAYTRVQASTREPSAAGDLSLIFNYMKMLDPGSVVRESEFATAAKAGSFGERMQATVGKVLKGERLSVAMRADFLKKSKELFGGAESQHKKREKSYTRIAKRNNLPVMDVVVDITAPPSEEDILTTMQKYNMTREQVMQRLEGI